MGEVHVFVSILLALYDTALRKDLALEHSNQASLFLGQCLRCVLVP